MRRLLSSADKRVNAKLVPKRDGPYLLKQVVTPSSFEHKEMGEGKRLVGKFNAIDLTKFQERPGGESPQPVMP